MYGKYAQAMVLLPNWKAIGILSAVLAVASLAACASAPVQEMSDARQAIAVAKQAGATHYAPAELHKAQRHLKRAKAALANDRYSEAKAQARQASKAAEGARALSARATKRRKPRLESR
jgi:hypothetical protein